MDKTYVLVKYEADWAYAMDVYGFWICTKDAFNKWKKVVTTEAIFPYTYYVGTNEDFKYKSADSLFSDLEVKELTEDEYFVLKRYFISPYKGSCWGHFPSPEDYVDSQD